MTVFVPTPEGTLNRQSSALSNDRKQREIVLSASSMVRASVLMDSFGISSSNLQSITNKPEALARFNLSSNLRRTTICGIGGKQTQRTYGDSQSKVRSSLTSPTKIRYRKMYRFKSGIPHHLGCYPNGQRKSAQTRFSFGSNPKHPTKIFSNREENITILGSILYLLNGGD